jgi:hypothetical protein
MFFDNNRPHKPAPAQAGVGGNFDAVKLLQMRLDLANWQVPGVQADDPIVETIESGLTLRHNLRLKAAGASRETAISIAPSSQITVLVE